MSDHIIAATGDSCKGAQVDTAIVDRLLDACDNLLAPVCMEAGRLLIEFQEIDIVPHLPPLKAGLFAELYDASDAYMRARGEL